MSGPGEHKTVQARILHYAQEIRWTYVSREEAKRRRRFLPRPTLPQNGATEMMEQVDDGADSGPRPRLGSFGVRRHLAARNDS